MKTIKTVLGNWIGPMCLIVAGSVLGLSQIQDNQTIWEFHFRKTPDPDPATGNVLVELSSTPPPATNSKQLDGLTPTCISNVGGTESWETIRFKALPDGTLEETRVVLAPGMGTPLFAAETPGPPGGGPWSFAGIAYQLDSEIPLRVIQGTPEAAADSLEVLLRQEWNGSDCHMVRAKAMWVRAYDRTGLTPPLWDVVMFQSWIQITISVESVEVTE